MILVNEPVLKNEKMSLIKKHVPRMIFFNKKFGKILIIFNVEN